MDYRLPTVYSQMKISEMSVRNVKNTIYSFDLRYKATTIAGATSRAQRKLPYMIMLSTVFGVASFTSIALL